MFDKYEKGAVNSLRNFISALKMTINRLIQFSRTFYSTSRKCLQNEAGKTAEKSVPSEKPKLTFQKRKSMLEHRKLAKSLKKHDRDVVKAELKTKKEYIPFGKTIGFLIGLCIGVGYEMILTHFGGGINQTFYDYKVKKKAYIFYGDGSTPVYQKRLKAYNNELRTLIQEKQDNGTEATEEDIEELQEMIMRKKY